jgi:hypothetical protein
MAANNTPIPDLIELSGISNFTTYSITGSGGGTILGYVDNATYTDGDGSNSATEIGDLNEADGGNAGTLTIDGTDYSLFLAVPASSGDTVTVTYDGGASIGLDGDGGSSEIVSIQAIPTGGGATRYFALIDDTIGDLSNITTIQTQALDFDPAGNDVSINADQDNLITVCFASGTRILTPSGERIVEDLQPGDLICTLDNGPMPLRWRRKSDHSLDYDFRSDQMRPVRIRAGALGPDLPVRDLTVSPQHRLLVSSPEAERLFGSRDILVPACKLTRMEGINRLNLASHVSYHHLYFGSHQIVFADGAPAESLLMAERSSSTLHPSHRLALRFVDTASAQPARPIVDRSDALKPLVAFHKSRGRALLSGPASRPWRAPLEALLPTG